MTQRLVTTKAELLAEIEHCWAALNAALDRVTEAHMTTIQDAEGWTVKDHVIHVTAWERSSVFFLRGNARHESLGVGEPLYLTGDYDGINAAIFLERKDLPLGEALVRFRDVHRQLLALLQPLTDFELQQRYRYYLPDEPGDGDGPPALDVVYGNSAHHFAEHLAWIEALLGEATRRR